MAKSKKPFICFISILLLIAVCLEIAYYNLPRHSIRYTELGIPLAERYPEGKRARCPSDMVLFEGRIYVGGGDYNDNMGPVDVWCYNVDGESWENSGSVPDEEVSRFLCIGGELIIPGIDPRDDWAFGNYYKLVDGEWQTVRTIPNGVHNFDMVEYNGMLFAALGVNEGVSPVVCSSDDGESFYPVEMKKNGDVVDTYSYDPIRVRELILFKDDLYAVFYYGDPEITYELYRYEEGCFVFLQNLEEKIKTKKLTTHMIEAEAEYGGRLYFTTGNLYYTEDMKDFQCVTMPDSEVVCDIYYDGRSLYLLCGKAVEDGRYKTSVWKCDKKKADKVKEIFDFTYDVPPLSFVKDGYDFYIGMGAIGKPHEKNGTIIHVDTR